MSPLPPVYDLKDPKVEADLLYILGIVPIGTLRKLADNVAQIRKGVNYGKVYLQLEKGLIKWIGVSTREHTD